jgi:hypothetical protein
MNILINNMSSIQIDISPSQMRKIRKGLPVRVKKGTGFNLLVNPSTYNIVSKSFNKGLGAQISLSPEEIEMNKGIRPEAHNPPTPPIATGSGIKSGIKAVSAHSKLYDELNDQLGTNYGYLSRAGLDNAMRQKHSASLSKLGIDARIKYAPTTPTPISVDGPPSRLISGSGRRDTGIVGKGASLMSSYTPPALVSQPFSSNFQFQFFLPPQYQQFSKGNGDL